MTNVQSRVLGVLLALVILVSSACGVRQPNAPTPIDQSVAVVTAVLPVPPFLKLSEITPPDGSTIFFGLGPEPKVKVEYQFDPNIPGTVGVAMYLSVDCVSVIPYTRFPFRGSGTKGEVRLQVGTPHRGLGISQTKCIVARIERMDGTGREVLEVVHTLMIPWLFSFKEALLVARLSLR